MENISIEVIGDAFADVYCYLQSGLPSLGGDSRLTEPIHTVAGGSGLNTTTHLASLFRYFDAGNLSTKDIISLQTAINENDIYGKLIIDLACLSETGKSPFLCFKNFMAGCLYIGIG